MDSGFRRTDESGIDDALAAAPFRAFRIHNDESGYRAGIEEMRADDLSPGEVLIKVAYSSVNYKDALAGTGKGKILRQFPLNGGIDVAGYVAASTDPMFKEGDQVLCTGCGLSETRDGGYAEYARLESKWTIPLPTGLTLRESMMLGTAGFTAALALFRCAQRADARDGSDRGDRRDRRRRLARDRHPDARRLRGARDHRQDRALRLPERARRAAMHRAHGALLGPAPARKRALGRRDRQRRRRHACGADARDQPYGNIAICGIAGGIELATTVMPFIIRGVWLLGVASAGTARDIRDARLAAPGRRLEAGAPGSHRTREVALEGLADVFATMLAGDSLGRTLVRVG